MWKEYKTINTTKNSIKFNFKLKVFNWEKWIKSIDFKIINKSFAFSHTKTLIKAFFYWRETGKTCSIKNIRNFKTPAINFALRKVGRRTLKIYC